MDQAERARYTAFVGARRIATGDLHQVTRAAKEIWDAGEGSALAIFADTTGELVDIDFRGTVDDVAARLGAQVASAGDAEKDGGEATTPRARGRPKLGVVAREVTLLPRHWEWLNLQPGGASVALRRLVDDARRSNASRDRVRQSQEAAYRFMSATAGNLAGFEEATRALFAGNATRFEEHMTRWPGDVRDYARALAGPALGSEGAGGTDTISAAEKPRTPATPTPSTAGHGADT